MRLDRARVSVALTVLVLFLPLMLVASWVINKHHWAEEKLGELEPRYARLLGLQNAADQLQSAANAAAGRLEQYAYPGGQDATQVGNAAQQRARKIFEEAGLTVVSSQVLAPTVEKGYDRLSISFQLEGMLPAVQAALIALAAEKPVLSVKSMILQSVGLAKDGAAPRMSCQITVFVLHVRS